jgi:hypothetical protein
MVWKSVARTGCLLAALTGCETLPPGAPHAADEAGSARAPNRTERSLREDAELAWQTFTGRTPQAKFTAEFREGFLDGHVEYFVRTGGSPGQSGHDKVCSPLYGNSRDYDLGFQSGIAVALKGGQAAAPTVTSPPSAVRTAHDTTATPPSPANSAKPNAEPVPSRPAAGFFEAESESGQGQLRPVAASTRPISTLPKPELPVIKPFNPDLSGGTRLPPPVSPTADLLPISRPPASALGAPSDSPGIPPSRLDPGLVRVPALNIEPPTLPTTALVPPATSAPTILGDIPVLPFHLTAPDEKPLPGNR